MREVPDQSTVRSQKVEVRQVFQANPTHVVEDHIAQLAAELVNRKELEIDCAAMPVIVAYVSHSGTDDCVDAELFIQLPDQCLLGALSWLNFATRELPLQGHRLIGSSLTDEDLFASKHEGCNDQSQSS